MQRNLTGAPDKRDYLVPKGYILVAALDANGRVVDYRDLGCTESLTLQLESEDLEHICPRSGFGTVDQSFSINNKVTGSFALSEANLDNVGMFLKALLTTPTNPAVAGVGSMGAPIAITSSVVLGRWYDLLTAYDGTGSRVVFASGTGVVIRRTSGTPADLVSGTDYDLDIDTGRIFIRSTASGVAAGDDIAWYSAAQASAPDTLQVADILQATAANVALMYVQSNPADSDRAAVLEFYEVSIKPDGETNLIQTDNEFATLGFTFTALTSSDLNRAGKVGQFVGASRE